jgi:subtilisin family serine protease
METKEYIVALHKGIDYNQFWVEIEDPTVGLAYIPDRPVAIADNLDALDRITHYFLTEAEAETLRNDPRVLGVEIPAEHRDDIIISVNTTQVGNFTKTNSSTGNILNWGLIRNSNPTNVYGSSTTTTENYNYVLTGSNVDIVIIDSGIQIDHPEFGNRVNAYQWTNAVNTTTFYTDYNGHGTHVAGIAAGDTYGWAKNSNIYAIKFVDAGPGDPDPGFDGQTFGNIANLLVSWQNSKSINPTTGVKNPTVVNMSFGYNYLVTANASVYTISNVNYRGNSISTPGWYNTTYGLIFGQGLIPARVAAFDLYVDQMTAAGMIVCKAAGNDGMKIDVDGGLDYNNYINVVYNSNSQPALNAAYYMRGSSPMSNTAIIVGALDSTTYSSALDKKANYSDAGPMVDIFAAGSNVQSSWTSNNANTPGLTYYNNGSFKQYNINGTSMASPQVAGAAALYLQAHPTATPSEVKSALTTVATTTMIGNVSTNPAGNDYSNTVSQWGGDAGVAYQDILGLTQIKNSSNNWVTVANVYVKTDSTTWTQVQNIYTKTDSSTWKQTY